MLVFSFYRKVRFALKVHELRYNSCEVGVSPLASLMLNKAQCLQEHLPNKQRTHSALSECNCPFADQIWAKMDPFCLSCCLQLQNFLPKNFGFSTQQQ